MEPHSTPPKGHHEGTKDTKKNNRKIVVDSDDCWGVGVLRVLRAFVVNPLGRDGRGSVASVSLW